MRIVVEPPAHISLKKPACERSRHSQVAGGKKGLFRQSWELVQFNTPIFHHSNVDRGDDVEMIQARDDVSNLIATFLMK
jgi:biotin synthase-related radical SAM superfamily protein